MKDKGRRLNGRGAIEGQWWGRWGDSEKGKKTRNANGKT
jgi:hypothetical protein